MATTTAMATQMEMLTASGWLPFPSYEADCTKKKMQCGHLEPIQGVEKYSADCTKDKNTRTKLSQLPVQRLLARRCANRASRCRSTTVQHLYFKHPPYEIHMCDAIAAAIPFCTASTERAPCKR